MTKRFLSYFRLVPAIILLAPLSSLADKTIVGHVETITVGKSLTPFIAKIDTGAEHSSLHVLSIKLHAERLQKWVSFRIKNKNGKVFKFKKRVVRMATIKRKSAPDQVRPVIELELCLGTIHKKVEVNLVDRGNFKYSFLVGKSFLNGDFLVDVEKSFATEPRCKQQPAKNLASIEPF